MKRIGLLLLLLPTAALAFRIVPELPDTATTSIFNQSINPGILSVDIVDGDYLTVDFPSVEMNPAIFAFACQTATGTFGTLEQQIYVKNPDAKDSGWVVSLAATNPAAAWQGASSSFDFNDPTNAGCDDGDGTVDADTVAGQMTVNPNAGILIKGACSACSVTDVTKGFSAAFNEDTGLNSITILTGAADSDDVGDWLLTGVAISQKIPGEQPAASDYSISLVLTII